MVSYFGVARRNAGVRHFRSTYSALKKLNAFRVSGCSPRGIQYAGRSAFSFVFPPPPSPPPPAVVASLGNNVPVPYLFMCDRDSAPICRRKTLKQLRGEERRGNRFSRRGKRVLCPGRQIVSARPYPREESYSAAIHCRRLSDSKCRFECTRECVHTLYARDLSRIEVPPGRVAERKSLDDRRGRIYKLVRIRPLFQLPPRMIFAKQQSHLISLPRARHQRELV